MKPLLLLSFLFAFTAGKCCECPLSVLSMEEAEKYEVIFRGTIVSVKDCGSRFGEAMFRVDELYKGNATREFKILFECGVPCQQAFNRGDEWIIYSRYKQLDNALMDWCSRSRKYFRNEKEDFYKVNYGNDYFEELRFLRSNLGLHRTLSERPQVTGRNQIPGIRGSVIIILCSVGVILLFYWVFNRYFR
jgi:hypothetical protein